MKKIKPLEKLASLKFSQWLFITIGLWIETITLPPLYNYIVYDITPQYSGRIIAFGNDALILNMVFCFSGLILIIGGIKNYG